MANTIRLLTPIDQRPGSTFRIEALYRDDSGASQAGRTVTYALLNTASGQWWDAVGGLWSVAKIDNAMAEVSAVDLPGVYFTSIDHAILDPAEVESNYLIEVISDSAGGLPVAPRDTEVVRMRYDLLTLKIGDADVAGTVAKPVRTLLQLWRAIKVAFTHNSTLDDATKKQIFYKEDGATIAMSFDVKDAAGMSSIREICRSERDT